MSSFILKFMEIYKNVKKNTKNKQTNKQKNPIRYNFTSLSYYITITLSDMAQYFN